MKKEVKKEEMVQMVASRIKKKGRKTRIKTKKIKRISNTRIVGKNTMAIKDTSRQRKELINVSEVRSYYVNKILLISQKMAPLNKARELAKREAAEKRKQFLKVDKENINGLSSVMLVKIQTPKINEINKQETNPSIMTINKARSINKQEQWNQPFDWRFVTENTLYKYIPFEKNINISQAMD
ncbi:hypothetical protein AGLY_004346 [Aphis glycines]|uniref:Uncharacterized protein n=1 Tax=Aphis glycines TaxID=307491 RepID=A0A6G0TYQ7_APHGL|nr:hypothetical protein AGLY_004346 [Aphis glycines]